MVLVQGKKHIDFYDLIEEHNRDVQSLFASRKIVVNLRPYEYLWLKPVKEKAKETKVQNQNSFLNRIKSKFNKKEETVPAVEIKK